MLTSKKRKRQGKRKRWINAQKERESR